MRNRGESQFEQLQLPGMPEPEVGTPVSLGRHAGDLSEDEWLKNNANDIYYHGTYRKDWMAPVIHMGGKSSAAQRMESVRYSAGIDPRSGRVGNPPTFAEYLEPDREWRDSIVSNAARGRIYARRVPGIQHDDQSWGDEEYNPYVGGPFSDTQANAAHMQHMISTEGTSARGSVVESSYGTNAGDMEAISRAKSKLSLGIPISYTNTEERDPHKLSVVVPNPQANTRSYLQDVADSPNRPERVRQYARQMHEHGYDPVRVAFPDMFRTLSSQQLSLPVKGDVKDEYNIEDPEYDIGKQVPPSYNTRKPWTDLSNNAL